MKYSLLLVCLFAVLISLAQSSEPIVEAAEVREPNLKYYHRYEKNHGQKIDPTIPVQQHYRNERHLREKADHVKDEITDTIHQAGFKVRELKRKVLALKNLVNRDKAIRNGFVRMSNQRENSIKEEINHEEKFKELYEQRLRKNQGRENTALPDQRIALAKLVKFDQDRIVHWHKREMHSQKQLQHTVDSDIKKGVKTSNKVAQVQAKIGMIKAHVGNIEQKAGFRIARLEEKLHTLENVIQQDIALDKKRAHNEVKESKLASSSKVVAESAL